jgi:hypothetical protein
MEYSTAFSAILFKVSKIGVGVSSLYGVGVFPFSFCCIRLLLSRLIKVLPFRRCACSYSVKLLTTKESVSVRIQFLFLLLLKPEVDVCNYISHFDRIPRRAMLALLAVLAHCAGLAAAGILSSSIPTDPEGNSQLVQHLHRLS